MRLSSGEEYGLRCLLQVARLGADRPVNIPEVAEAEALTPEYVAKLLRRLRQGGVLRATRGAHGGYHLARPAETITLLEVTRALDGTMLPEDFCGSHSGKQERCVHASATPCELRQVWDRVERAVDEVLESVTVADLVHPPQMSDNSVCTPCTAQRRS